jgi:hypothetical protein
MIPRRTRPEGCLSDFALDLRLARELDVEEATARAHLETCARCTNRLATRALEREAFAKDAPPLEPRSVTSQAASLRGRRRWWQTASGGAALAAAACLVLFFAWRRGSSESPAPSRDAEELRTKGEDAKLGFYVNHAGRVRAGGPHERVVAGDGLRFVVTARSPRYLAVLSVDGKREVTVYYPSQGTNAAFVPAGSETALPESTTLDDTLGAEVIYGVFCVEPFAIEPLRRALRGSPERAPTPEGCTVDTLLLDKEAAPPP